MEHGVRNVHFSAGKEVVINIGYEYFYGIQADQFTFYRVPKLFFTQEAYRCMTTDDKLLYGMRG